MENRTSMEATRNENESGKMVSAGSSHFEPPKLVLGFCADRDNFEVPTKDILDDNYDYPLDLSTRGCSSTQNFQPEDLAGVSETPQGHLHSLRQQTREKSLENSCSVLRKDASVSKSIAKWPCGKCPRWFRSESALNVHIQNGCDPKPYKCDICSSEFAYECQLKNHQVLHTEEKPYKCDHCEYTCNRKQNLQIHTQRMHSK